MAPFVVNMLRSQLLTSIPYPTSDFSGQTVMVTGSNTGLGREAAKHLVRLNAAKVILAVRTISKGEAAAMDIIASCNAAEERVEVWELDMSSHQSIKDFAQRTANLDRLDAAVLNAGVMSYAWSEHDGMEQHMGVNVVGTILLLKLLHPVLQRSAEHTGSPGRMTVVGSGLMNIANLTDFTSPGSILDKFNERGNIPIGNYYRNSKLLTFYATRHLAELSPVAETNVIVTVQTPGVCESDIFRDDAGLLKSVAMKASMAMLARSAEVGGRTLVHAVTPDLPVDAHGRFLVDCQISDGAPGIDNEEGLAIAKKWNKEIFELVDEIVGGRA
ncbi:hypothetical protein LTR15_009511 [Elasticomyces elasticus]|nr:hypothetical protein LTR15_009511 [Elasticomyces elasticus]